MSVVGEGAVPTRAEQLRMDMGGNPVENLRLIQKALDEERAEALGTPAANTERGDTERRDHITALADAQRHRTVLRDAFANLSAADAIEKVAGTDDEAVLEEYLAAEKGDKERTTVIQAIKDRKAELRKG